MTHREFPDSQGWPNPFAVGDRSYKDRSPSGDAVGATACRDKEASIQHEPRPAVPSKDDLTCIRGIGPTLEEKLYRIGITRYRQLVALRDEDLDKVNDVIGMVKGRIHHLGWREKARALMARK